jgi:tripartite-type tricarboxylate transporter receptor subunit TctC
VSLVATNPLLIGARKDMLAKDLKELIAWLKSNPDKATQWTAGLGTTQHLARASDRQSTSTCPLRWRARHMLAFVASS